MPQTVLAFLAMMIVTLLSLNQQQSMLLAYELMVNDEMEFMASAVALQAMEYVTRRDFDAAVSGTATVAAPSELQDLPFITGNSCELEGPVVFCVDLDDFHKMLPDTLAFTGRNSTTFSFAVSTEIYYVDDALNPDSSVTYQTFSKIVAVEAADVMGFMDKPIRLTRLVACEPDDGCL
jgi:hypothetical protein